MHNFIKRLIQRNNGNPAGIPALEQSLNRFKDEMETKKHRNYEIMAETIGRESAKPFKELKQPEFEIDLRKAPDTRFIALAQSMERYQAGVR